MTIPSAGEATENLDFPHILRWNTNGTTILEDNFSVSYQVKHLTFTKQFPF